jgi:hypothetical protein
METKKAGGSEYERIRFAYCPHWITMRGIPIEGLLQYHTAILVDTNQRLVLGSQDRIDYVLIGALVLYVRIVGYDGGDAA